MENKRIFLKGIYFNSPHEKAPSFVVGNISIQPEKLIAFLNENKQYENKGYLKIDVLEKKKPDQYGKYNLALNTWKPEIEQ